MKHQVLVVDDQESVRQVIRTIVEQWPGPPKVDEAENGRVALDLLAQKTYTLVVLDINMPIVDGFEVLKQIRAKPETSKLAVVMLTSEDSPEAIASGMTGAATSYLTKPFNLDDLQEVLKDTLG